MRRLRFRSARSPWLWWGLPLGYASSICIYPRISVVHCRRFRYVNELAQTGFFHQGHQIQFLVRICHHNIVACSHPLLSKIKGVDGPCSLFCSPCCYPLFVRAVENGLCWADSRAHWAFALAGAVIAQVALAHVVPSNIELGYAEGAGIATV